MSGYSTSLCWLVIWYRRLTVEVVLGTAVVNAYFLHKKIRKEKVPVTKSRENIFKGLLNHENVEENTSKRRWEDLVKLKENLYRVL
jgi:hypothetical protein